MIKITIETVVPNESASSYNRERTEYMQVVEDINLAELIIYINGKIIANSVDLP